MSFTCLEYRRLHLPDGGKLIPFPTDMYRVIMWFIHLRGYILLSRAAGLHSKGFDAWKPFNALTPIKTVFSRATWESRGLYSRSYERQGRNTEPNQQGTGDFLLLYAY